ncbi:uncharacterized protein EI97DRAFT_494362 [Westerdykella ornata]|uniref:Apple domain-containing protein n=1 Tax=Westerdykella ornata TaxID=318751 RepID=A0A6A6JHU7_WESOR|nr:uncharacterized protein EI97DRAFT_494362 [Westerdykella ornata]KAF2275795.1 hypothetical protein EI97DRAFT_494362 [Westerdykella ornata]
MKPSLLLAAALAASVNGAAIEARQRRTSTRVVGGDVEECGLDAFVGHTSEASLFCSSMLKGGTATVTTTYTSRATTTTKVTVITTLYPPSSPAPTTTIRPPTSSRTPSSTVRPPTSSPKPSSTVKPSSTLKPSSTTPTPSPSTTPGCGLVGYTKSTSAYYFDSSGTKNNFAACSAACKADSKCKSFGYGEANCMLFDVLAGDNTNYNPMSPYTFYDSTCPQELPVLKARQVNISLGLPPAGISSACSCLIGSGPGATTTTLTTTVTSNRVTVTQTVTRTVSLLPEDLL